MKGGRIQVVNIDKVRVYKDRRVHPDLIDESYAEALDDDSIKGWQHLYAKGEEKLCVQ